jgi:hypothetical protein
MEEKRGIAGWITTLGNAPRQVISNWKMKRITKMSDTSLTTDDVDVASWSTVDVTRGDGTLESNTLATYRATVDVTDNQLKDKQTLLRIGRIDDHGAVFVNGTKIADTHDWSQVYTFDIAPQLHVGKNTIAINVRNGDGAGGVAQGVSLEPVAESSLVNSTWEFADESTGTHEKWWSTALDDSSWKKDPFSGEAQPNSPQSLLTWHRLKFNLPDPTPNVWVPWKIRIEATGNGFLYLNDHALGRYWQIGPQREYFLPECWLKTGKGQTNVLTIALRPTEQGASVNKAEVSPYAEWAEKR